MRNVLENDGENRMTGVKLNYFNEDYLEDLFDESIKLALKIGRKYMKHTYVEVTKQEWSLAMLLFKKKIEGDLK